MEANNMSQPVTGRVEYPMGMFRTSYYAESGMVILLDNGHRVKLQQIMWRGDAARSGWSSVWRGEETAEKCSTLFDLNAAMNGEEK